MIEIWWAIWASWAWWRYNARKTTMPVLSRDMSRGLLKSLVDDGITDINKLEAYGVRPCDIEEWREEINKTTRERLERDIEERQHNIIKPTL
jgi:hypothetical protein